MKRNRNAEAKSARHTKAGLIAGVAMASLSALAGVALAEALAETRLAPGRLIIAQASSTLEPSFDDIPPGPAADTDSRFTDSASGMKGFDVDRAAIPPCGAKIVGGCAALKGAWPSMATLHPARNTLAIHCGGTIIDPYWILTAAHCVTLSDNVNVTQPTRLSLRDIPAHLMVARESVFRLGRAAGDSGRVVKVAQIIRHPDYQHIKLPDGRGVLLNDIALIRLAKPANAPRQALASKASVGWFTSPGQMATITGFGDTLQGGKPSPDLLQVDVPVVSEAKCQTAYPMMDYQHRLCAGVDEGGKDSCQGDSGGPLFVRDQVQQPVQVGIVSYGLGCARPNAWGVYSSVGAFEGFIRQHVPNAVFTDQMGTALASGSSTVNVLQSFTNVNVNALPSQRGQVQVEVLPGNSVKIGDLIRVKVTSSVAGRLLVFNRDEAGRTIQLFPNNFSRTTQKGQERESIAAGQTIEIPDPDENFALRASAPPGVNEVIALIAPPNAKTADLTEAGKDLRPIADFDRLIRELSERSSEAEQSRALSLAGEAEVEAAEAAAAMTRPGPPPQAVAQAQPSQQSQASQPSQQTEAQQPPQQQGQTSGQPPAQQAQAETGSPSGRAIAHRKYEIVP